MALGGCAYSSSVFVFVQSHLIVVLACMSDNSLLSVTFTNTFTGGETERPSPICDVSFSYQKSGMDVDQDQQLHFSESLF